MIAFLMGSIFFNVPEHPLSSVCGWNCLNFYAGLFSIFFFFVLRCGSPLLRGRIFVCAFVMQSRAFVFFPSFSIL